MHCYPNRTPECTLGTYWVDEALALHDGCMGIGSGRRVFKASVFLGVPPCLDHGSL